MSFAASPPPLFPARRQAPTGFALCQEPHIVQLAVNDCRTQIELERDTLTDTAVEGVMQRPHPWFFWRKRCPTRQSALEFIAREMPDIQHRLNDHREEDLERLLAIEDRLSSSALRSEGIGVIIPQVEFQVISEYYTALGGVAVDGTRHVEAAAAELREKMRAKKPRTQRPPKPEPRKSIIARGRRNLDLDE